MPRPRHGISSSPGEKFGWVDCKKSDELPLRSACAPHQGAVSLHPSTHGGNRIRQSPRSVSATQHHKHTCSLVLQFMGFWERGFRVPAKSIDFEMMRKRDDVPVPSLYTRWNQVTMLLPTFLQYHRLLNSGSAADFTGWSARSGRHTMPRGTATRARFAKR